MAPSPDRNGLLHGLTAQLQKPRGVGQAEGAGSGQRGIFAERMTGDEAGDLIISTPPSGSSTRRRRC